MTDAWSFYCVSCILLAYCSRYFCWSVWVCSVSLQWQDPAPARSAAPKPGAAPWRWAQSFFRLRKAARLPDAHGAGRRVCRPVPDRSGERWPIVCVCVRLCCVCATVVAFAAFAGRPLRLRLRLPPCVCRDVSSVSLRLGLRLLRLRLRSRLRLRFAFAFARN